MRVAALCESELEDDEAALQWYRGVLDFEPGHQGALSSLERIYTGHEAWSELIQTFEMQIANTANTEEQIGILSAAQRELVIDRVMALETEEIEVEQIKWVVLMVLFSQPGQEAAYARMEDLVFEDSVSEAH